MFRQPADTRIQRDGRLSEAGRQRKVADLDDKVLELCGGIWSLELPVGEGPLDDFRRLVNEMMRLMLNKELFTFVTSKPAESPNGHPQPASGNNNKSERHLRSPAQCRDTGRTSKTVAGCRRKSVIISVFSSLSCYLKAYTLEAIISEVASWASLGGSCFERLAKSEQLRPPDTSVLDSLLPVGAD